MSAGIRTISQLNMPFKVSDEFRCPGCGGHVVIRKVRQTLPDGQATKAGLVIGCRKEPPAGSGRWRGWNERHGDADWGTVQAGVLGWFNQYLRYRPLAQKTVANKRALKWRRMA